MPSRSLKSKRASRLLAGLILSLTIGQAVAEPLFYVVIPAPGKHQGNAGPIAVSLSYYYLPTAEAGTPYSFNMNDLVTIDGDPSYQGNGSGVTWAVTGGTLPAGLKLSSSGLLSGTPSEGFNGYVSFTASYKGNTAEAGYLISVNKTVVNVAGALPLGNANQPYVFDLSQLVSIEKTDPNYGVITVPPDPSLLTFTIPDLPPGFAVEGTILSGTPTTNNTFDLTIQASYSGTDGQPTVTPLTVDNVVVRATKIVGGTEFFCALQTDSTVVCWGDNTSHQLGAPAAPAKAQPSAVRVQGLNNVVDIAAGLYHACALTSGGAVLCWGSDFTGEMGAAALLRSSSMVPYPVDTLSAGVKAIGAMGSNTCALMQSGGVKCWGGNQVGLVGPNLSYENPVPTDIAGISDAKSLSVGYGYGCVVRTGGGVLCWGTNEDSAMGVNTGQPYFNPPYTPTGLDSGVAEVYAGSLTTCAKSTAGGLYCWGYNGAGNVGVGNQNYMVNAPTPVPGMDSGISTAAVGNITCAVKNGTPYCWGLNLFGGVGPTTSDWYVTTPHPVPLNNITQLAVATQYSACALDTTHRVFCWGTNWTGELGRGYTSDKDPNPAPVGP